MLLPPMGDEGAPGQGAKGGLATLICLNQTDRADYLALATQIPGPKYIGQNGVQIQGLCPVQAIDRDLPVPLIGGHKKQSPGLRVRMAGIANPLKGLHPIQVLGDHAQLRLRSRFPKVGALVRPPLRRRALV